MGSVGGVDPCTWRSWIESFCKVGVLCFWVKAAGSEACYSVMTLSSEVECRYNSQVAQRFVGDQSVVQSAWRVPGEGRVDQRGEERGMSKAGKILDNKLENTSDTSLVFIVLSG